MSETQDETVPPFRLVGAHIGERRSSVPFPLAARPGLGRGREHVAHRAQKYGGAARPVRACEGVAKVKDRDDEAGEFPHGHGQRRGQRGRERRETVDPSHAYIDGAYVGEKPAPLRAKVWDLLP